MHDKVYTIGTNPICVDVNPGGKTMVRGEVHKHTDVDGAKMNPPGVMIKREHSQDEHNVLVKIVR